MDKGIAGYGDRELSKKEAYTLMSAPGAMLTQQVDAANIIIHQWFERSKGALEKGRHCTFEHYRSCMLAWEDIFAEYPELAKDLRSRYRVVKGEIPPGTSYWVPKGTAREELWERTRNAGNSKP